MRSVIDITDLSVEELYEVIDTALDIIHDPDKYREVCKGKKLAALFFEPSTRTRLSFESAMLDLGGSVLSVAGAGSSSAAKGESVADTAKIVSCYADIIAIRHPLAGSAYVAAKNASIPLINAGDGGHCHPTQTTADLLTIYRKKGGFSNMTIGLCGDLLYGRTVHSLINAMSRYPGNRYVLISPEELKLPDYMKEEMDRKGLSYQEVADLETAIPELDILYMTRIQRERFDDQEEYERLKDVYILTEDKLKSAKPDMTILHPLPRVNEISAKVDGDSRADYFEQAYNGKYMRMALILKLLKENEEEASLVKKYGPKHFVPDYVPEGAEHVSVNEHVCKNSKCITATEQELDQVFIGGRCLYCESKL